jgi:Family of unknown function (DUF5947)
MTAPPPFRTLRRFLPRSGAERCGLCGAALAPGHPHLFAVETRRLVCACDPCSILFERRGALEYRRVGRDVRTLPDFRMSDAEWESLLIPIGLAFFVYSTAASRVVALYPGPAGLTESMLSLEAWSGIAERNPAAGRMQPDVEALLVNRVGGAREHYLVPIDRCYELTGLIRMHWRGLSGGEDVWREIGSFFQKLKETGDA